MVVIDDSLSSGTSFREACMALEDEGYEVEGTACLVDFPGGGGRQHTEGRGYRVETSFDIWDDIGMLRPPPIPGFLSNMPRLWSRHHVPRWAASSRGGTWGFAEHYLPTGEALRPPTRFDEPEIDPGGAFVSLRRRSDDHRLGRKGFWHFEPVRRRSVPRRRDRHSADSSCPQSPSQYPGAQFAQILRDLLRTARKSDAK